MMQQAAPGLGSITNEAQQSGKLSGLPCQGRCDTAECDCTARIQRRQCGWRHRAPGRIADCAQDGEGQTAFGCNLGDGAALHIKRGAARLLP